MTLSLTDGPIDAPNIDGVYIEIDQISISSGSEEESDWITIIDFTETPELENTFNLLDLVNGELAELGVFDLPAGEYHQIRMVLNDIAEPLLTFSDTTPDNALTIPSGSQSGIKITGDFTIPVNGDVSVILDFDIRKSIIRKGNGTFSLKPTMRIIVENQAGAISGTITPAAPLLDSVMVYAYESGTYTPAAEEVRSDTTAFFSNAVTSDVAEIPEGETDYTYILPYLAAGNYTIIVASHSFNPDPDFGEEIVILYNADNEAGETPLTVVPEEVTYKNIILPSTD